VKAKVAQPKVEHGWAGVPNQEQLKQKIKTENPKNIPPPTHAAARPAGSEPPAVGQSPAIGGSPAAGAGRAPVAPSPRGKPGRVLPGATAAPAAPAGVSPSPFERGKAKPGARPQPGLTGTPAGRPAGVSPAPFERDRGKPGERPQLGVTATPAGARTGISPSPFERGERPGRPAATAPPAFRPSPPPPEHGRPPARKLGESPGPGSTGGAENIPQPGRGRGLENQKFGTPPPTGAGAIDRRGVEQRPPPGVRRPNTPPPMGEPGGEARGRGPAPGQPGGPPRGGAPAAAAERKPGQPERGNKKPERPTPPPGPQ
jgi:hypothetical protein